MAREGRYRSRHGDPVTAKPEKVRVLVARLKRRGVVITLIDGRVQVSGWTQLESVEKEQLRADRERVVMWLESRELRRQRRAEKRQQQQPMVTAQQQQQRKVVGQIVNPGGPLRLLYADEVEPIPATARVIGKCPYGWKFGGQ